MSETNRIAAPRLFIIDGIRGIGVIMMVFYHLAWDVYVFRLIQFPLFTHPGWMFFASLIPVLFLTIVGYSLVLASRRGLDGAKALRRFAVIASMAALISFGSRLAFPDDWIFFGILHCIAVASLLGLVFLRLPFWLVAAAGVGCLLAPSYLASPMFNDPWLRWVGLMTFSPRAYDYVPIFPWFGWTLFGMALGKTLPEISWRPGWAAFRPLEWLGRHSLAIYMLHQPPLYGTVWAISLALS